MTIEQIAETVVSSNLLPMDVIGHLFTRITLQQKMGSVEGLPETFNGYCLCSSARKVYEGVGWSQCEIM